MLLIYCDFLQLDAELEDLTRQLNELSPCVMENVIIRSFVHKAGIEECIDERTCVQIQQTQSLWTDGLKG